MTLEATPLRYHGPGFRVEFPTDDPLERDAIVWLPGMNWTTAFTRIQFKASWSRNPEDLVNGESAYVTGSSLEEVLAIFPTEVADAFRKVICS